MHRTPTLLLLSLVAGCGTAPAQPPTPPRQSTPDAPAPLPDTNGRKASPSSHSGAAAEAGVKPAPSGFQLVAATDLIYIIGRDAEGRKPVRILAKSLFRVLRNGKGPVHELFDIAGKPVGPVWSSSNHKVLTLDTDAKTGAVSYVIRGPGKTTVKVSVGDWSADRQLTIVLLPLYASMSPKNIISKVDAFPKKKSRKDCLSGACYVVKCPIGMGMFFGELSTPPHPSEVFGRGSRCEYWEYPQWPRCTLVIHDNKRLLAIVTWLSADEEANLGQSEKAKVPASRKPKRRKPRKR